ncbi:MAG: hypothetical protein ACI8ZF_000962 [Candidatus Midichloriaceae bacterium]
MGGFMSDIFESAVVSNEDGNDLDPLSVEVPEITNLDIKQNPLYLEEIAAIDKNNLNQQLKELVAIDKTKLNQQLNLILDEQIYKYKDISGDIKEQIKEKI